MWSLLLLIVALFVGGSFFASMQGKVDDVVAPSQNHEEYLPSILLKPGATKKPTPPLSFAETRQERTYDVKTGEILGPDKITNAQN